jgi:hypothetical protein
VHHHAGRARHLSLLQACLEAPIGGLSQSLSAGREPGGLARFSGWVSLGRSDPIQPLSRPFPKFATGPPLPPRSPELNPVENVWQFMRDNWLSNRIFTSYSDILDHCCAAWNKLIDQPWRIMSLGLRDWAHGS